MIQPTAHLSPTSPRADDWRRVFGDGLTVPIRSPVPAPTELPIGTRDVYLIDIQRLNEGQLDRLVAHLAERFKIDREVVRAGVHTQGVPILAEDVVTVFDLRLVL